MSTTLAYILVAAIFLYYLGLILWCTRLAIRSGRLKNFREISPHETVVLFSGLDRQVKQKA